MSMIVTALRLKPLALSGIRTLSLSAKLRGAYTYDEFKPGRKPQTREEMEAAAKKYNLLPSEYEPCPDHDGLGRGDYPKLPDIAVEDRDPSYPWDDPALKRNFNETMHAEIDLIGEDRYHISKRPRYTYWQMMAAFVGLMSFWIGLYWALEPYPMFRPVLEKQLPKNGTVHYTFEPKNA